MILRIVTALLLCFWHLPAFADEFLTAEDFFGGKYSGFNLVAASTITAKDVADMGAMGARIARYHLKTRRCQKCDYYLFPAKELQRFNQLLEWARLANIKLILAFDPLPAREDAELWDNKRLQDSIVKLWGLLATAYKDNPTVAGFDIMNEPVAPASLVVPWVDNDANQWPQLAQRIVSRIRSSGSPHIIFYEPSPLANPGAFKRILPLLDTNIVYSFHFYEPHLITHQGVHSLPNGVPYPGNVPGRGYYDKNRLRDIMQPVRNFSRKYRVPVQVGEFSCIRWAPDNSRDQYLKDVLELFAEESWPWLYHSFREWQGWDAELPANNRVSMTRASDTSTIVLIRQGLSNNK